MEDPIETADDAHGSLHGIHLVVDLLIIGGHHAPPLNGLHHATLPVLPVVVTGRGQEHHGDGNGLGGLNQGEGLEQLIQRAHTARHGHQGVALPHQEVLAGKKVTKSRQLVLGIDVAVADKLEGQIDVETVALVLSSSPIGCFHHPLPGPGNHLEA